MKNIWKYTLQATGYQCIKMPKDTKILTVQNQDGVPCLWCLLNPDNKKGKRQIITIGTGHPIIDNEDIGEYVGTYQLHDGALVFHVFDKGYK